MVNVIFLDKEMLIGQNKSSDEVTLGFMILQQAFLLCFVDD